MPRWDVAVVGAGYAGAAAALFLAQQGHRVTVYEAVPEPGPVGAGILLQPSGMLVLARLGAFAADAGAAGGSLLEAVLTRGAPIDRLRCRTGDGRPLFELSYGRLRPGLHGLGLHRGVLFQALFDALAPAGVEVLLGRRVVGLSPEGRLLDDEGHAHGPHELVVIADGARSELRAALFPGVLDEPYPWGALWFVAEDHREVFRRELLQIVQGTRRMFGLLPTGRAPRGDANLTSLFWSVRASRLPTLRRQLRFRGVHVFRDWVRRMEPRAEALVQQIEDPDQLLFAEYRDVRMSRWYALEHSVPVVAIGDAAHAMSPQLGQGSNLALLDAMALAEALDAAASLPEALIAYQAARRTHLRFYQRINRWLTPFFQSDSATLGWLRDLGFPLANDVPWLERAMLETLCGVRRGFLWSRPLELPTLTAR